MVLEVPVRGVIERLSGAGGLSGLCGGESKTCEDTGQKGLRRLSSQTPAHPALLTHPA